MKPLLLLVAYWVSLHSVSRGEEDLPEPSAVSEETAGTAEEKDTGRDVGGLGRSNRIVFEGNTSFRSEVLRAALTRDVAYVLASHPSERLDRFLPVISERLRLGYRHSGFPDAKVSASHRVDGAQESILVSIAEGPRYRQGRIRVEGAAGIDTTELAKDLQRKTAKRDVVSYADRIRAFMATHAPGLPPSEVDAVEPAIVDQTVPDFALGETGKPFKEEPALTYIYKILASGPDQSVWDPGEALAFGEEADSPMIERVNAFLSQQGRPLAKLSTRYERRDDGSADLVIHIEDLGPEARIGTVSVEGNVANSAEEISRAAGLLPGLAVTPARLDEAELALWRSGRFFPFAIDKQPRGDGSPEIDFRIRVRELEQVPPLSTPATPDQEVVLRFIDWLNSGIPGGELLIEREDPALGRLIIGWAPQDLWILNCTSSKNSTAVSLALSGESASIAIRNKDRALAARLKGFAQSFAGTFQILPSHVERSELGIAAAIGFSTKARADFFSADLLITPAYVFIKPEEIRRKGDRVIINAAISPYALELDAATARPLAATAGDKICKILTAPGSVRERQRRLDAELAKQDADTSAIGWVDGVIAILKEGSANGWENPLTEPMIDTTRKGARLIDLLAKPKVRELLRAGYADLVAELASQSEFTIPFDPGQAESSSMMALLAAFGYLGWVEEYFPEAEWAGTFAREMMFILGGKTRHSAEVMGALLADPGIGPCGSLICAQLLDEIDPPTALRFRTKARQQCSPEAFREDWKLLANSSGPLGRGFARCLEDIASFSAEDEAMAGELLPKNMSGWLHSFLGELRKHSAEKPWSDTIAAHMDRLWNEDLGARLREQIERELLPSADPAEVAALVDGIAVPHDFVRVLEEQHLGPLLRLSVPEFIEARPWTKDRALAGAIRMILLRNLLQRSGNYPADEAIEKYLNERFADLAGKPDEDWILQTGLSRARLGEWAALAGGTQQMLLRLRNDHGETPDDLVLRDYYEARAEIYGVNVDTDMIYLPSTEASPGEVARFYQRAEELGKLLGSGRTVAELESSGELQVEPAGQVFSRKDASLASFQYPAMKAIASLKPGEATEPMELGSGIAVFVLRASRKADAPDFEEAKDGLLEHWRDEKVANDAREWFEEKEANAVIQMLEVPEAEE